VIKSEISAADPQFARSEAQTIRRLWVDRQFLMDEYMPKATPNAELPNFLYYLTIHQRNYISIYELTLSMLTGALDAASLSKHHFDRAYLYGQLGAYKTASIEFNLSAQANLSALTLSSYALSLAYEGKAEDAYAVWLNLKNAVGETDNVLRVGGYIALIGGRLEEALYNFSQFLVRQPNSVYGFLWYQYAKIRAGEFKKEEVETFLNQHRQGHWPEHILDYLSGTLSIHGLAEMAYDRNPEMANQQYAEAFFAIAELYNAQGMTKEADYYYKAVKKTYMFDFIEYAFAAKALLKKP